LLNLPEQIIQTSGKKTIFTYDALGTKLRKQEYTGTTLTLTSDYLGSVQYLNGTSQFAATAEGRVYNNGGTFRYDYFMKDQVGNIRMTFTANGTGVTVLQRDEYYPLGNTFDSYLGSEGANTYKFNGMEFEENNLNTFDYHARMYDPQIGRSFQPDPHADVYASKSPFSFLGNNPICITDPTGMDEYDDGGGSGGGDGFSGSATGDMNNGNWFTGSGKAFRGAGGFYAAFNPRGQFRAEQARYERSMVVSWIEHYVDHYFSSEYNGTHFTDTEFKGRTLELNEVQGEGDYLVNQVLHGVNVWDHENQDWDTRRMKADNNYSISINKLRVLGVDYYINPSGLNFDAIEQQYPNTVILGWTNWMGQDAPFPFPVVPMKEKEFNDLKNAGQLDSGSTYFKYRSGFESDGVTPIVGYGFIRGIYFDPKKY
jgi:RHS repeat-associated protein